MIIVIFFFSYLLVGILVAYLTVKFAYKYKMWKKTNRDAAESLTSAAFQRVHNTKQEQQTPRVGGVMIWLSILIGLLSYHCLFDIALTINTVLIIAILVFGGLFGIVDDYLQTRDSNKIGAVDGVPRKYRLLIVAAFSILVSYIFHTSLSEITILIPIFGFIVVDFWVATIFGAFVMLCTYTASMIDGIDGLAATTLLVIFSFLLVLSGGAILFLVILISLLIFLWNNVPPAKIYMGETGIAPLTLLLGFSAMMTKTELFLPIFGIILVITVGSSLLQIVYFKIFRKRIFSIAPLHFALLARGWSRPAIVLRYSIVTALACILSWILFTTTLL